MFSSIYMYLTSVAQDGNLFSRALPVTRALDLRYAYKVVDSIASIQRARLCNVSYAQLGRAAACVRFLLIFLLLSGIFPGSGGYEV